MNRRASKPFSALLFSVTHGNLFANRTLLLFAYIMYNMVYAVSSLTYDNIIIRIRCISFYNLRISDPPVTTIKCNFLTRSNYLDFFYVQFVSPTEWLLKTLKSSHRVRFTPTYITVDLTLFSMQLTINIQVGITRSII